VSRFAFDSVILAAVLCAAPLQSRAQAPSTPQPSAAMKAVAFLAGHWEGQGWMRRGPGEPQRFQSVEQVEPRLDGSILTIEGRHWESDPKVLVHNAFAVLSASPSGEGYDFRSYLADGRGGSFPAKVVDGAFVWQMSPAEGTQIRYTIRVDGAKWHEVGEMSRDGTTWMQFFGMDLQRQPTSE